LNFLAESDNTEAILNKVKTLSKKHKKNKIKEVTKIDDYVKYEKNYYDD